MYENDGQYYIEIGKKPATAPPGAWLNFYE
jgi:hypothetical protein